MMMMMKMDQVKKPKCQTSEDEGENLDDDNDEVRIY
jgi:hypothetical protein